MSLLKFNCFLKIESTGSSLEHYYSSPLCFCLATSLLVLDTLRSGTLITKPYHIFTFYCLFCVCVCVCLWFCWVVGAALLQDFSMFALCEIMSKAEVGYGALHS